MSNQSIIIDLDSTKCICGQDDYISILIKRQQLEKSFFNDRFYCKLHSSTKCKYEATRVPVGTGSCNKCCRVRLKCYTCRKICIIKSCLKCKYKYDGTTCFYCDKVNLFGKCQDGHDGTCCIDCHKLNQNGKCPRGHNGTKCITCKIPNINGECIYGHGSKCEVCNRGKFYGNCVYGHDGTRCKDCNQANIEGKCVYGHDGTYCSYCKELNINGKCKFLHTGETCLVCNELKTFKFGHKAQCESLHSETYCPKCNTAIIHDCRTFHTCLKCNYIIYPMQGEDFCRT